MRDRPLILTGWKQIEKQTGLGRRLIRKLVETDAFPLQYVGRHPCIADELIVTWLNNRLNGKATKKPLQRKTKPTKKKK